MGDGGTILTSTDGTTWTERLSVIKSKQLIRIFSSLFDVTYGNGLFVTVGRSGTILTSPDGISWTKRTYGYSGDGPGGVSLESPTETDSSWEWVRMETSSPPLMESRGRGLKEPVGDHINLPELLLISMMSPTINNPPPHHLL